VRSAPSFFGPLTPASAICARVAQPECSASISGMDRTKSSGDVVASGTTCTSDDVYDASTMPASMAATPRAELLSSSSHSGDVATPPESEAPIS
jgi:hypothetical protein